MKWYDGVPNLVWIINESSSQESGRGGLSVVQNVFHQVVTGGCTNSYEVALKHDVMKNAG